MGNQRGNAQKRTHPGNMYEDTVSRHIAAKKKKQNASADTSSASPFNLERNAAATWHRNDGGKCLDTVMATIQRREDAVFCFKGGPREAEHLRNRNHQELLLGSLIISLL